MFFIQPLKLYHKFSPQNRGLSRKKVVFRPPAWIKWERLTLSCPGTGRAVAKIGHSNLWPGSKELMYDLLIFFQQVLPGRRNGKKHVRLFSCVGHHLWFRNCVTVIKKYAYVHSPYSENLLFSDNNECFRHFRRNS